MSTHPVEGVTASTARSSEAAHSPSQRVFGLGLVVLGAALALNTALGPLGTEVIAYPITGTLLNQTIGLEAVTISLVVPLALAAGLLALRGHEAAPLLGFGPSAYTAYMFVQYILGPEYRQYTGTVLFHTVILTLSGALTGGAWVLATRQSMPPVTSRRRRVAGTILLVLGAFILSRYLPVIMDGELPPEFAQARTFFWSIFMLDLGAVVPATLVAGVALLRDVRLAHQAWYALMGWYALVPPSVAAMSLSMVVNDDPHAAPGQALMFGAVGLVVAGLATWTFRPLLRARPADARHPTVETLP